MQFYLSSLQYSFIAISYKLFPSQSITTITGKFSTSSFLIDSVPKSSYAITSLFFMHFDKRAPAPPIAAKIDRQEPVVMAYIMQALEECRKRNGRVDAENLRLN